MPLTPNQVSSRGSKLNTDVIRIFDHPIGVAYL